MTEHSAETSFCALTPAEQERLALLAEELAEAIQIVGKILRHGYESTNPLAVGSETHATNRMMLERELGDISCAIRIMRREGDVRGSNIEYAENDKMRRVGKWLHHNKGYGE